MKTSNFTTGTHSGECLLSQNTDNQSDLKQAAFDLYTPPFRFYCGYIFDSEGHTVADQDDEMVKKIVRIRGWGRIGGMDNPEALQDKIGELTTLALTEYWEKHKGV